LLSLFPTLPNGAIDDRSEEEGEVMKKEVLALLNLGVLAFAGTGCGRIYPGNYQGSETINLASRSIPGNTVRMTVYPASGNVISGTWESPAGNGTFQGTIYGDQISPFYLTVSSASSTMQSMGGIDLTASTVLQSCRTFSGTLTINASNQWTGILTYTNTPAVVPGTLNTNTPTTPIDTNCLAITRQINLSKIN
jgi:hypothetical protein